MDIIIYIPPRGIVLLLGMCLFSDYLPGRILVQVAIYHKLLIGRDGPLVYLEYKLKIQCSYSQATYQAVFSYKLRYIVGF